MGAGQGEGPDGGWDDDWTEDDELRYQEHQAHQKAMRRRHIRQALVFLVVVLVVLGIGVTAAGVYQGWWPWPPWKADPAPASAPAPCPTAEVTAAPIDAVTVTVLNSTRQRGLAAQTAAELEKRGFTIAKIGNDRERGSVSGPALVRHGPAGLLPARTVAAQVDGAELAPDDRKGEAVELALGEAFSGLRDAAEAVGLLEPAPVASPPSCQP